jgi:hypothetical protein
MIVVHTEGDSYASIIIPVTLTKQPRRSSMTFPSKFSKLMVLIFLLLFELSNVLLSTSSSLTLRIIMAGKFLIPIPYEPKSPTHFNCACSAIFSNILRGVMHESWKNSGPSIHHLKPYLFIFHSSTFLKLLKYTTYPVNIT